MRSGTRARWITATALALGLASCAESTRTLAPGPEPPIATSAMTAVRRFEWAIDQSDADVIADLLTADFELISAELDSAGNPSRGALDRESVMIGFRAMLEGVPGRYPPAEADLTLDRNLISFPDTRAGLDPRVHRTIRTFMELRVHDAATASLFEITGPLLFFLTRGDSATVPPGEVAAADSLHWWVRGIDDGTSSAPRRGASTHPARIVTLRSLLDLYRARAGAAVSDSAVLRASKPETAR
jgi:hypothetical protein